MNYRRALVIRFGGLGDILLTTPSIRALSQAFPGIAIDYVVGGGMTDAVTGHPCIRNVITFDKRGPDSRLEYFLPFLFRLRRERYDLVVNLHPSAKSYLMARAVGASRHLTFSKEVRPNPKTGRIPHAIEDFAKELRPLGIHSIDGCQLDFTIPASAHGAVDKLLRASGVPLGNALVVINPAASRPINRWPVDRFMQVAAYFANQPNKTVVITGASRSFRTEHDKLDEVALAQTVAAVDPRVVNVAGCISIKELGALLARSSAFLTCDTGPMHVGAAVGAPMVVLSGAADPDRTGPRAPNAVVLIDRSLSCAPCRARTCSRGDLKCMDNLSVEMVIGALNRRMNSQNKDIRGEAVAVG